MDKMASMKIAFICHFPGGQLADALTLYQEMGVDEIDLFANEIDAEVKRFVEEARENGIPVSSLSPRWGWIQRALDDPSELDRLKAFIQAGPELSIERIMLSCSFVKPSSEEEMRTHLDQVVEINREITECAEAAGIDLCTHTTTRPGTMFGTVEGIDAFLEGVGNQRNKLLLCCGCVSAAGWDVPALIRHWDDAIGAVHLFNPHGN